MGPPKGYVAAGHDLSGFEGQRGGRPKGLPPLFNIGSGVSNGKENAQAPQARRGWRAHR